MIEQLRKVWQRRELLYYMVKLQMKADKKNKLLGFAWSFLDPLLMLLVYIILVSYIFGRGGPQFPILLFVALISWRWFTISLSRSVNSITGRRGMIQSVRFPLAILPLTGIITAFFDWLFGFIILLPMLFIFEASFSVHILWLPLLLVIQFIGTIGACLIFAVVGTYLSDLGNILQFLIRLGFFLSPILYSVRDIIESERLAMLYMLGNPFAGLLESYKNVVIRGAPPNVYALWGAAVALVVFLIGLWYFSRDEHKLVKAI